MDTLLTTQQVQQRLRVDRTTIYRMVEAGRLPAVRVGKQWRFDAAAIEQWLGAQTVGAAAPARGSSPTSAATTLAAALPLACCQLIQDAFADILGVLLVVTDLRGLPVTSMSDPGHLAPPLLLEGSPPAELADLWAALAAGPELAPRFLPGPGGLRFARGLIRVGQDLAGMLVLAAPDPSRALVPEATALRSVQRIADIFAHIAEDRGALCGRLAAIAELTSFDTTTPLKGDWP